ncbi:MAG: glycosyltransferase family 2 protein, partial [Candidatus Competibacteraceae bacterium]|nr:glycosyltransferase family 2 protein [Candidatus Competibacteraceae bacterium]
RVAPRSRFFNPESVEHWTCEAPLRVDIVSGCFLLMRTEHWRELNGFDLSFFMYGEDADLCLRARETIGPCILVPDARIVHYGGASEPVRSAKMIRLFRAKSQLFRKHASPSHARLAIGALLLWGLIRIAAFSLASAVGRSTAGRAAEWVEVVRAAGNGNMRGLWHAADPKEVETRMILLDGIAECRRRSV